MRKPAKKQLRFQRIKSGKVIIVLSGLQAKRIKHKYVVSGRTYSLTKEAFRAGFKRIK